MTVLILGLVLFLGVHSVRIVADEHEAVACITRLVSASRRTRLAEARWDPYTWVRVEGDTSTDDVLLSRTVSEDVSWQAASTSL